MRMRSLLIASYSLLCAAPVAAQATAAGDPISGRWVENGVTFLDLKFDGKSAVSGKIDDGTTVPFVIEGNVANDTLRVSGSFGNSKGSKTLTRSTSSRPPGNDAAAPPRMMGLVPRSR